MNREYPVENIFAKASDEDNYDRQPAITFGQCSDTKLLKETFYSDIQTVHHSYSKISVGQLAIRA